MDGARGLIDLNWSQQTPIFHPDDIDQDPRFNQYPYPEDDLDYDDEEELETDYQKAPPGGMPMWPHQPVPDVIAIAHRRHIRRKRLKVKLWDHPRAFTQTLIRQWRWVV